jgi:AraC-like DNA-binding protein
MPTRATEHVVAWRPAVPGVREVFHAHFTEHAYPVHTHATWTLLVVDDGAIEYDLDRRHHDAAGAIVTLLPPDIPHDGKPATDWGFRKRVVYLDADVVGSGLAGRAADNPGLADALLRRRVAQLHDALTHPGDELEAESRLALVAERLRGHLGRPVDGPGVAEASLPDRLRGLLDADITARVTLDEVATILHAHPSHLVRAFSRRFGLPPHRYVTGRRIDAARRLLLEGMPVAEVAATTGFYDQAHLTRHFRAAVGTTPASYAASGALTR